MPVGVIFNLIDKKSILHEIRPEIGDFATLRFWRGALEYSAFHFGKSTRPTRAQVYVPKTIKSHDSSWMVAEIGKSNTEILCRFLGGVEVSLPNGSEIHREEARRIIAFMKAENASVTEIINALEGTYPTEKDWITRQLRAIQ